MEETNKIVVKNQDDAVTTLKIALGFLGPIGTLINETVFEHHSRIKQNRVNTFVSEFSEYMIKFKGETFELDKIDSEQIGDIFEEIIISTSRTSALHKRLVFKRILMNQIYTPTLTTDETLRFINITNELTEIQFKILIEFNKLGDNFLKYKVQILELQKELKDLKREVKSKPVKNSEQVNKLMKRIENIPRLIKRKRNALQRGNINPNHHSTFSLNRETYITEMQDLIAKGLLFDFVLKTQIIDPYIHFGITKLGRSYMNYISD